jgi:serine/threonine-protein kinase
MRPSSGRKLGIAVVLLLVAGLVGAVIMLLMPKTGTLVVNVAGPGGKALDAVQISVDGTKKCETSPCTIEEIEAGKHTIKVTAPGYAAIADKIVKVKSGDDEIVDLTLAAASGGTGVRVSAEGTGLKLFVDGQEIGPLPAEVKDLTPGEHTIKVAGNDRYEPFEKKVTVEADKLESIGPVKLKVLKGLATIQPGANADDAKVVLVSGTERRPIPSLPIKIDITTDKSYTLEATKKGFATYRQPITFEDGQAEKTFDVSLSSDAEEEPAPAVAQADPGPSTTKTIKPAGKLPSFLPKAPAAEKPAAAAGGGGKLNANSIPVSKVLVDGVPQGQTPKMGMNVSAGTHTVTFVHPEHGRKSTTVNVKPGGTATAVVKFP